MGDCTTFFAHIFFHAFILPCSFHIVFACYTAWQGIEASPDLTIPGMRSLHGRASAKGKPLLLHNVPEYGRFRSGCFPGSRILTVPIVFFNRDMAGYSETRPGKMNGSV